MASVRERTLSGGQRTWAVLYRHGGKQASKTFATAAAAEDFKALVDLLGPDRALKAAAAEDDDGSDDRMTVAELAERWLSWKAARVTGRTATDYRRDVDNWIVPMLGHKAAELLDETDVQEWVDDISQRLAPKSVSDRHMYLHSMYQWGKAKSRRLVTHNPCLETEMPTRTKKPPKGTTVPQFHQILTAAAKRNQDAHDLILFFGETGWRFSEGVALSRNDVEDDGVDVWVTVSQVFRIDGQGRQVLALDSAKSYAAFRRIRLFPDSAVMIRRRIVGLGAADLVFTNSHGRHWNQNTFLRETWPRIVKDAGLYLGPRKSPTPHWLRHMHVAVLAAAGAPIQEIQRRIGHESIATTIDVYGGLIGDLNDDAIGKAAELMAGRRFAPGIAPVVRGEVVTSGRAIEGSVPT